MWFVKAFLAVVVLAVLLYISLLNAGQKVDIHFPWRTLYNIELPVALLGSFILGVVAWFLVSLFQVIAGKTEVASLKRRNRELMRELTDLRNMPVQDLDPDAISSPVIPEED